jgi:hypothetical protein
MFNSCGYYENHRVIGTEIEVNTRLINLGDVKKENSMKAIFSIKNVGSSPLLIDEVTADCHCTVPSWKGGGVSVGDSISIEVIYKNPTGSGHFQQVVNVYSNAKQSPLLLVIRGRSN